MVRDKKVDTLKGIAIFIVVLGHVVAWCLFGGLSTQAERDAIPFNTIALWKTIYSFHMPLFFFLSGYLFMNPEKSYSIGHVIKRCITYMIPFFSAGMLLALWRGQSFQGYWYFRTLTEFTIILFSLLWIFHKTYAPPKWVVYLLFVSVFKFIDHSVTSGSLFDTIFDIGHMDNCLYFGLGWLVRLYKIKVEKFIVNQYMTFSALLAAFLCTIHGYTGRPAAILWIILMINLADAITRNKSSNYLTELGSETKFIYIIHPFLGIKVASVGKWLIGLNDNGLMTNFVLQLFIAIPVTFAMIWITIKITRLIKSQYFTTFILMGEWNFIDKLNIQKSKVCE